MLMTDKPQVGRGASSYNVRVKVQQNKPTTTNPDGQPVENWQTQFSAWAQVLPRGGSERRVFQQLRAEISHLVRLRVSSQAKKIMPADWRFVLSDGTTLNLSSKIDIDLRHVELQFECTEVQVAPPQ